MEVRMGSFDVGTAVCLDYTAPPGSRVGFNFSNDAGDILLHVNPRYDENVLVLNSYLNGHWGTEERPSGFPLHPGRDTYITVVARDDGFVINSNGKEFCYTYKYRKPVCEVRVISTNEGHFRVGKELTYCQPGKVMYVQAKAPDSGRFSMDFLTIDPWETTVPGKKDIALHFNPRFDEDPPVIVRNTYINGHWGEEERSGGMPLKPGETFIVAFTWQLYGFEIAVNGWPFACTHPHRLPTTETMTFLTQGLSTIDKMMYR